MSNIQRLVITLDVEGGYQELVQAFAGCDDALAKDPGKAATVIKNELNGLVDGSTRTSGCTFAVTVGGPGSAASATKTVAVTFANLVVGDFLLIGDRYFTAVASGAVANEFNLDTDSATTATSLRASINADSLCLAAATGATNQVILTADTAGTDGNKIRLATSKPTGLTWTGTQYLVGGVDAAVTYTILA